MVLFFQGPDSFAIQARASFLQLETSRFCPKLADRAVGNSLMGRRLRAGRLVGWWIDRWIVVWLVGLVREK